MVANGIKRVAVLFAHRILTSRIACRVCRHPTNVVFLGSRICIKSCGLTTLAEAEAMRFVSANTTVPVPKVHLAFEHKNRVYIVMERVKGKTLSVGWMKRSPESKERVFRQLQSMIREIRNLKAPDGTGVANVLGGPICDQRLPGQTHWGPFESIRDFHRTLRSNIELENIKEAGAVSEELGALVRFHEGLASTPIFTHGDLSSFNILAEGDQITAIIDWETAGWMPSYWEYTSAWNANPQNRFWQHEVDKFLDPQPRGLEMEAIRRRYFGDF
ncbi:hypothetical protein LLEC1_00805 [Akanthomyces lecanii]|uniref:Aminoglycoside phosphotransferase domain-containing protein n=1 Tax=Cordyceps confragosa TaxID=2714763 RepID=A0A179I8R6_CORDF|nr:hypothetical protein LLEC1_00805 [Akanthomyces lecanii]